MMYQKNRKMKITVLQSKETKNENRYCKLDIPIYIVYIRHTFRWRLTMGSTSDTLSVNYKFETSSVMFP